LLDSLNDIHTHTNTKRTSLFSVSDRWRLSSDGLSMSIHWSTTDCHTRFQWTFDIISTAFLHICFASLYTDFSVCVSPNKEPLLQRKPESAGISRDSCGNQANVTFYHLFFLIDFLNQILFLHSVFQFTYIFTLITNSFSHSKLTATSHSKFTHPFIVLSWCNPSFYLL